jgi:hypothetical protein
MKRLALVLSIAALLAMPGAALAFHHGGLPAEVCSATVAGDPSNTNGQVRFGLSHNHTLPLPPAGEPGSSGMTEGTPGNGQGEGGAFCANGPID